MLQKWKWATAINSQVPPPPPQIICMLMVHKGSIVKLWFSEFRHEKVKRLQKHKQVHLDTEILP